MKITAIIIGIVLLGGVCFGVDSDGVSYPITGSIFATGNWISIVDASFATPPINIVMGKYEFKLENLKKMSCEEFKTFMVLVSSLATLWMPEEYYNVFVEKSNLSKFAEVIE